MSRNRIVNLNELELQDGRSHGDRFAARHARVSPGLGSRKLGYNVTEIAPGKTAFPYHFHHVNEELFLVLSGTGKLRSPDGEQPLREGDLVCCPPGADGAHQILNDGDRPLRYLALSTTEDPEVVEYPDSGKYGVMAGRGAGKRPDEAAFWAFAFAKDRVDYWAGED